MKKINSTLNQALNYACCNEIAKFQEVCYTILHDKIHRIAYRYSKTDSKDLTQNIFLKIFEMDINKLKHIDDIESYLLKIARNYCLDYLKKKKITEDISKYQLRDKGYSLNLSSKIDLKNALDNIPERQAVAIRKQLEGYKIEEIAGFLDSSEGAVKNLIYYGKQNIKNYLQDQ